MRLIKIKNFKVKHEDKYYNVLDVMADKQTSTMFVAAETQTGKIDVLYAVECKFVEFLE